MKLRTLTCTVGLASAALVMSLQGGCSGRPSIFANPDPSLRKTSTELAADAAKRFPYKEAAPRGVETQVRAQVGYALNRLEVVNFTGKDWSDVEVWVNGRYVCHLPTLQDRKLKEIHFPMLFDENGRYFPMDNRQVRVEKVEVYRDGVLYPIKVSLAD